MTTLVFSYATQESFYQHIEKLNDRDAFSLCIQALDEVPSTYRDYRWAYTLARALQNYAILGDRQEGCAHKNAQDALLRAKSLLESVKEQGKEKAEWNMRMAYAYQYLDGQKEKALPYAKRWARLDPEDRDAFAVIEDCTPAEKEDNAEETARTGNQKGAFLAFCLLSKGQWDKKQFARDLEKEWGITIQEPEEDDNTIVFDVGNMMAAVSLMAYPIPDGEAEELAKNNYMWPQACAVAQEHCAHLLVTVLGKEENLIDRGLLFTKLVATCCQQQYVTGVCTSGVVFEPRFYRTAATMIHDDLLPIYNWIWFGLYRTRKGLSAYTYGMDIFGKSEMEVLDTDTDPETLQGFLSSLVVYVLSEDVTLQDGETIGFSQTDKHTITKSPGVALPEQRTLKVSFQAQVLDRCVQRSDTNTRA